MAASKIPSIEPNTAVTMKTVMESKPPPSGVTSVPPPEPSPDPFPTILAPLKELIEANRKEAFEVGKLQGRADGLQRALTIIGIAAGDMDMESRPRLSKCVDQISDEAEAAAAKAKKR